MKKFIKYYTLSFLFTSLFQVLLALSILRRYNITYPYVASTIASFIMALFISFGILLFNREKGSSLLNTIFGFIVILPSLFVLRRVYDYIVFRYTFVIYLLVIIVACIYGIAVIVVHRQVKQEVDDLNKLLKKENNKEK